MGKIPSSVQAMLLHATHRNVPSQATMRKGYLLTQVAWVGKDEGAPLAFDSHAFTVQPGRLPNDGVVEVSPDENGLLATRGCQ